MQEKDLLKDSRRKNWFWDFNDIFDSSLSAYAILVRLYLARCADNTTRQAFPSLKNIAEHCKISRTTVKKAIAELIKTGWLQKETRCEDGVYTSNIYTLCYPQEGGRSCDDLPCNEMTPPSEDVGRDTTGEYVASRPTVGRQTTTNNTNLTIPTYEQEEKRMSLDSNSSLRSELESKLRTPNSSLESVKALSESIEDPSTEKGAETSGAYRTTLCLSRAPEGEKACQFNTDAREENKTPCFDKSFNRAPGGRSDRCSTRTAVGCRKDKPLPGAENNVCLEDDSKLEPSEPDKSLKNPLGKRYSSVVEATPGEQVNNNHSSGVNAACCSPGGPDVILTAGDIIAVLGDSLREVLEPPAKAYAIAGRLYNMYDFPAAEVAINALRRRVEQGHRIQNPVAYLMKVAREKKKEFEAGETREFEEQKPFSEKYPEEHKRRLEEVRKIYAERRQYLEDYLEVTEKQTASVVGFSVPAQVVADCPP